jgi:hypothetical protein
VEALVATAGSNGILVLLGDELIEALAKLGAIPSDRAINFFFVRLSFSFWMSFCPGDFNVTNPLPWCVRFSWMDPLKSKDGCNAVSAQEAKGIRI